MIHITIVIIIIRKYLFFYYFSGEWAKLRIFVAELAASIHSEHIFAVAPTLYIRFNGTSDFQTVRGLPKANYVMRGPSLDWPQEVVDFEFEIPDGADRIEVYAYFDRISWTDCRFAYDMMECPTTVPVDGEYVSNYGRNFSIRIRK